MTNSCSLKYNILWKNQLAKSPKFRVGIFLFSCHYSCSVFFNCMFSTTLRNHEVVMVEMPKFEWSIFI